jgi:hypothetical protein
MQIQQARIFALLHPPQECRGFWRQGCRGRSWPKYSFTWTYHHWIDNKQNLLSVWWQLNTIQHKKLGITNLPRHFNLTRESMTIQNHPLDASRSIMMVYKLWFRCFVSWWPGLCHENGMWWADTALRWTPKTNQYCHWLDNKQNLLSVWWQLTHKHLWKRIWDSDELQVGSSSQSLRYRKREDILNGNPPKRDN